MYTRIYVVYALEGLFNGAKYKATPSIFLSASTVAENGRKTCLKLKVFVRPSSKCLHATECFETETVKVLKPFRGRSFGYLMSSSDTSFHFSHKGSLHVTDEAGNEMKGKLRFTLSECCHELCCSACFRFKSVGGGGGGGLQMSLTYLEEAFNDL